MRAARQVTQFRCEGTLERELRARGFQAVAGVDEVGRGALFGPVVAAAVILSPDRPVRGLNDSKQLEPERREVLAERIRERAVAWAVAAVDAATIDWVNIYQASRMAMEIAVARLSPAPDFVLTDAMPLSLPTPQRPSDQGRRAMPCHRRRFHRRQGLARRAHAGLGRNLPEYGLAGHKGYFTPEHARALKEFGPTPLHRLSFEPVRERSLFPVDFDAWAGAQMELFAMVEAAS